MLFHASLFCVKTRHISLDRVGINRKGARKAVRTHNIPLGPGGQKIRIPSASTSADLIFPSQSLTTGEPVRGERSSLQEPR